LNKKSQQFESLVRSFYQPLFRYAYWIAKDKSIAEDLVQETYAKAWKNLKQLKTFDSAKPWLFTILNRENARRFARKQLPMVALDDNSSLDDIADSKNELDKISLERAISKLPIEYREPLTLQIVGGFTTDEISKIMTLNSNTVSTRIHRAKTALKNAMAETKKRVRLI